MELIIESDQAVRAVHSCNSWLFRIVPRPSPTKWLTFSIFAFCAVFAFFSILEQFVEFDCIGFDHCLLIYFTFKGKYFSLSTGIRHGLTLICLTFVIHSF